MVKRSFQQKQAIEWLLQHREVWGWANARLAQALKDAKIYSPKMRLKDIRIITIKRGVLDELGKPMMIYEEPTWSRSARY